MGNPFGKVRAAPAPAGTQNLNPSAETFGAGIAQEQQRTGSVLGEVGQRVMSLADQIQERRDALDITRADNEFNERMTKAVYDPDSGYFTRQMGAANGLHGEVGEYIDTTIGELRDTVGSKRAQEMFELRAGQQAQQWLGLTARYQMAETEKETTYELQRSLKLGVADVLMNPETAQAATENFGAIVSSVKSLSGKDGERLQGDSVGHIWGAAAQGYANIGKYAEAEKVMNEHADDIAAAGINTATLRGVILKQQESEMVYSTAEALSGMGSLDAVEAALGETSLTAEQRDQAATQWYQRRNMREQEENRYKMEMGGNVAQTIWEHAQAATSENLPELTSIFNDQEKAYLTDNGLWEKADTDWKRATAPDKEIREAQSEQAYSNFYRAYVDASKDPTQLQSFIDADWSPFLDALTPAKQVQVSGILLDVRKGLSKDEIAKNNLDPKNFDAEKRLEALSGLVSKMGVYQPEFRGTTQQQQQQEQKFKARLNDYLGYSMTLYGKSPSPDEAQTFAQNLAADMFDAAKGATGANVIDNIMKAGARGGVLPNQTDDFMFYIEQLRASGLLATMREADILREFQAWVVDPQVTPEEVHRLAVESKPLKASMRRSFLQGGPGYVPPKGPISTEFSGTPDYGQRQF